MASARGRFELQARIFIENNQIYDKKVIPIVGQAIKLKDNHPGRFFGKDRFFGHVMIHEASKPRKQIIKKIIRCGI
jgi:hypothetical protein